MRILMPATFADIREVVGATCTRAIIASACVLAACSFASRPANAGEEPAWLKQIFNGVGSNNAAPRPPQSVPSSATTTKTNHRALVLSHAPVERAHTNESRVEATETDMSKHIVARPSASAFPPIAPLE
jgi:hypothetical protein